jgi:hypothetical protein
MPKYVLTNRERNARLTCSHQDQLFFFKTKVKGCGIPLSVTGSRKGSFLKINPSLETVISSFQTICQTLDRAPKHWWNEGQEIIDEENVDPLGTDEVNTNENDEDGSSDEEMVTLDIKANDNTNDIEEEDNPSSSKRSWLREIDLDSDDEED